MTKETKNSNLVITEIGRVKIEEAKGKKPTLAKEVVQFLELVYDSLYKKPDAFALICKSFVDLIRKSTYHYNPIASEGGMIQLHDDNYKDDHYRITTTFGPTLNYSDRIKLVTEDDGQGNLLTAFAYAFDSTGNEQLTFAWANKELFDDVKFKSLEIKQCITGILNYLQYGESDLRAGNFQPRFELASEIVTLVEFLNSHKDNLEAFKLKSYLATRTIYPRGRAVLLVELGSSEQAKLYYDNVHEQIVDIKLFWASGNPVREFKYTYHPFTTNPRYTIAFE